MSTTDMDGVCKRCTGCCYGMLVDLFKEGTEIPLTEVYPNQSFDVRMTAQLSSMEATTQSGSKDDTTLVLQDIGQLPDSGIAYLKTGTKCIPISWGSVSDSTLTLNGKLPQDIPEGTQLVFVNTGISGVNTDFTGTVQLTAEAGGNEGEEVRNLNLYQGGSATPTATFTASDNGVKTITVTAEDTDFQYDQPLTINVEDTNTASEGNCGSASTTLLENTSSCTPSTEPEIYCTVYDADYPLDDPDIVWCGETWTPAQVRDGTRKCVCPTTYSKARSYSSRPPSPVWNATERWLANGLSLRLSYAVFYSPANSGFALTCCGVGGKIPNAKIVKLAGIAPIYYSQSDRRFIRSGYVPSRPVLHTTTSIASDFIGVLTNMEFITFSNYGITNDFFGSYTTNGVQYTWEKGAGW